MPKEGSVRLQKINCRDRPFKRSLKQIWLPPPATCEVSVTADLPTANCFCPEPIPPQILPGVCDSAVQVDMPQRDAMDEWVSLMTDYSSVDNLEKAVSESRKQLEQSQLQLRSNQQAEAALHTQVASLTTEVEHLRSRLQDLTDTHNDLMDHSMAQLETIGSLRSQLTNKSSNAEPILRFLRQLLLPLPSNFDDDLTPDDTLYHFLCCAPDADTSTIFGRANLLLKCLHSADPSPRRLSGRSIGRLVTLFTLISGHSPLQPSVRSTIIADWRGFAVFWEALFDVRDVTRAHPMGFQRLNGVLNILNWSCSLATAHRRHPVSLASVQPASFGGTCCPGAPNPFSCSVLCALG